MRRILAALLASAVLAMVALTAPPQPDTVNGIPVPTRIDVGR